MLEELGVPYEVYPIDIMKNEQFAASFLALNPNNKIPVIVDPAGPGDSPFVLYESGAILVYLARKFDSSLLPADQRMRLIVLQWLMFQMGGIGPIFGQLHHFRRYAPDERYSLTRYQREVHRIYNVLNGRLEQARYLAGNSYTIADVATYPWISRFELHGIEWNQIPNVKRWHDLVGARPAVMRGMEVPRA